MNRYDTSLGASGWHGRGEVCRWILGIGVFPIVVIAVWGVLFVMHLRSRSLSIECGAHQYQLGFFMMQYQDKYGHLPPAHVDAPDGRRMHSWRILVTKGLMITGYDFNEAWDSAKNKRFGDYRPSLYACSSDPATAEKNQRLTNYFVVTGSKTPFPGSGTVRVPLWTDPRGTSNTILIVEASNLNIEWLEPRDLTFDHMSFVVDDPRRPSISSFHPDGPFVCMADGSVRSVKGIDPEVLRAMLKYVPSPAGGKGDRRPY